MHWAMTNRLPNGIALRQAAKTELTPSDDLPLRAGVVESGERLVALNRPAGEINRGAERRGVG